MSSQDLSKPFAREGKSRDAESANERLRVLLVEDHGDTRMSMEVLLRRAGYYVRSAESAAEADRLGAAYVHYLLARLDAPRPFLEEAIRAR